MANEKIEVDYRQLGEKLGIDYHHKFLLYPDKTGRQYTIRGWMGKMQPKSYQMEIYGYSLSPSSNVRQRLFNPLCKPVKNDRGHTRTVFGVKSIQS